MAEGKRLRWARRVPRPGVRLRGSITGRPILAALDLLGRRWTLRILWELLSSPAGFRDLQARCGSMSASVLSTRLQELRSAALVATAADGKWQLTLLGRDLNAALAGLQDWSGRWAREPRGAAGPRASARRHSLP